MSNRDYTGEGILIGIYDEPIDTTANDLRELDNNGASHFRSTPAWDIFGGRDRCCQHGTLVTSVAAGNGWSSEAAGGRRYQYHGVAFKSRLISNVGDGVGGEGDINNHSTVLDQGYYNDLDRFADSILFDHKHYRHTVVYAAGNNGDRPMFGNMQGHYSILNHAKNSINVGATYKETDSIAPLSSLGPTADGRIKPDIVAPGASYFFPERSPLPLKIRVDSLVIYNHGVKIRWDFDPKEGWRADYKADDFRIQDGILGFTSRWRDGWITNANFTPFISSTSDTLVIGYRFIHPDFPSKLNYLQCGITWHRFNADDSLLFNLPTPDTNGHEARFALANLWGYANGPVAGKVKRWKEGIRIDSLWLGFHSDTVVGIRSAAVTGSSLGAYIETQGTSEAAPYVTGIGALMLQMYQRRGFLKPGQDIHHNAPWNSTVKAILIHTATDLIKTRPLWTEDVVDASNAVGILNPDLSANEPYSTAYNRYYRGPDYATGYGLVNAQKAVAFVDTAKFKQDSLPDGRTVTYTFAVPKGSHSLRATLTWDDYPADLEEAYAPKLVNDLDLILVAPDGKEFHPWVLDPLPQKRESQDGIDPIHATDIDSAYRGVNWRDNVEVVDVPTGNMVAGIWKLIVNGTWIEHGPQDFSVVCDYKLKKIKP